MRLQTTTRTSKWLKKSAKEMDHVYTDFNIGHYEIGHFETMIFLNILKLIDIVFFNLHYLYVARMFLLEVNEY